MTTIPTIVESAIHEASHAVLIVLMLKRRLASVEVDERGGGLTRAVPQADVPPLPRPWEQRAIDSCAINFAGAVGAAKHCKYPPHYDYDFEDHGAESDLANFNFKAEMICGTDRDRIAALRHLAMKRAHELVTEFWNPIVEVSLDLLDRRRLNHAEVVAAIRRSAAGAKALGIEEHRREPQRPAYRAVTFARGSVLETESGHLLAIRSDGHAHHFRSLGEAYGWL